MTVFTNYLEKLGSNFLVSALVPSLALVVASILVFNPILDIATVFKDPQGIYQLVSFGMIIFIFTVIIGFTLTALNTYILKMFEGYVIFPPIRFLYNISRRKHEWRAGNLAFKRENLKSKIRNLEGYASGDPKLVMQLEKLQDEYYKVASEYSLVYPENLSDILPTRFGNTLKAAENYSGERYGFDGIHFFPRLVQVIPAEYRLNIDAARNELSFLVNMSMLSITFSMMCILAIFYSMWSTDVGSGGAVAFISFLDTAIPYFFAAAIGFVSSAIFYNASIFSVSSFGLIIRSSFDLFRLDLLNQFGIEKPKNSIEEFETWNNINELVVLGNHSLVFEKIDYSKDE
jgi:hypothetical protein